MNKKDQDAIALLYSEAAAFYSGGSRTEDDPLGLGNIRMAKPGENPFSGYDSDDTYHDEDLDDFNEDPDNLPTEDEIQDELRELYAKVDPYYRKIKELEQQLIDVVSKRKNNKGR